MNFEDTIWTYDSLCRTIGAQISHRPSLKGAQFKSIWHIPSKCMPGVLYAPMVGGTKAQHRLIERALSLGARAALTSVDLDEFSPDKPVIHVENIAEALSRLSVKARNRFNGEVIAITGSVGKSSVNKFVSHILDAFSPCFSVPGNFNGNWGVSSILASLPMRAAFSSIEIAASGPGTMSPRASIAKPTVGIVTNASYSHGEKYKKQEDLLREKLSLLDYLSGRELAIVGRAVLEADQSSNRILSKKHYSSLLSVGTQPTDAIRLRDVEYSINSVNFRAELGGRRYHITVPCPGYHTVENALFALAVAHGLELDIEKAILACTTYTPPPRRMERFRIQGTYNNKFIELIDDSFNASPDSARVLLDFLRIRRPRRKLLVFSDMLELGRQEKHLHLSLTDDVRDACIDILITVGPLANHLGRKLRGEIEVIQCDSSGDAATHVLDILDHGDLLAIKGSHAMKLSEVVETLKTSSYRVESAGSWAIEDVLVSSETNE